MGGSKRHVTISQRFRLGLLTCLKITFHVQRTHVTHYKGVACLYGMTAQLFWNPASNCVAPFMVAGGLLCCH